MVEVPALDFSLQATLSSGQAFRWTTIDDPSPRPGGLARDSAPSPDGTGLRWHYGFIGSAVVKVRQDGARLLCESADPSLTPSRLQHYFALDLDYSSILSSINVDMQVHQAIVRYRGLRVLQQHQAHRRDDRPALPGLRHSGGPQWLPGV